MNNKRYSLVGKNNIPHSKKPSRQGQIRMAVVVEDLRLPLDEGAKKTSFSIICSLVEEGAIISTFTRYGNPLLENVFSLPDNKFLFGFSFARNLKEQFPDAILYIPSSSGTIGAFARAAMMKMQAPGIPLAMLNLQYRDLSTSVRYFCLPRYADIVFTQSQTSASVFRSLGCNTFLLPGGVNQKIFRPASKQEKHLLRSKYGFQDNDQIVLHVGHCSRGRNVMILPQLVSSGLKVILIASTSTPIDHDILDTLKRGGVMVVTDFIETIQHFYQLADCYLFPVFYATSAIDVPLSILEAMACNLPIVTTRFGALPSMFEDGNGLYYGDTNEEIVSLVRQAVEKSDCRTIEKVAPFSWNHVAKTILETLKRRGDL